MNDIDRIKILIRYMISKDIADSQKDLGQKLGYSNESYFSQIINGKVQRPKDFGQKLKSLVPQLNESWLLNGEGNMINGESQPSAYIPAKEKDQQIEYIRLLPLYAQGGSLNDFSASVYDYDCEMIISPVKGASFAMQVSGDSMSPEYPNGSRIIIKKIDETSFIEWGRVYVLDTNNGSVIKIIVPSDREDCIRCISINKDPIYAPFDVPKSSINGVYRVLMCMAMK